MCQLSKGMGWEYETHFRDGKLSLIYSLESDLDGILALPPSSGHSDPVSPPLGPPPPFKGEYNASCSFDVQEGDTMSRVKCLAVEVV